MLNYFKRKIEVDNSLNIASSVGINDAILTADKLLQRNQKTVDLIREQVATTPSMWSDFYMDSINRFAEFVQSLPASQAHHHSNKGGLLEHTLQTIAFALKIRRGVTLPPGVSPEIAVVQKDYWTWAVFLGALCHDLGKVATDVAVQVLDESGNAVGRWSPYYGPMTIISKGTSYKYVYVDGRKYIDHQVVTPTLLHNVISVQAMDWLSRNVDAQQAFLSTLAGDRNNAVGNLLKQADSLSAQKSMGGKSVGRADQSAISMGDKLSKAVQYLLMESDKLTYNKPGAAVYVGGDDIWVVSKRFCDVLRDQMITDGHSIPHDNNRLMDVLAEYQVIEPRPDGKAVWSLEISIGEWVKTLTFLKLSSLSIFPDMDKNPIPSLDGRIIVQGDKDAGGMIDNTASKELSNGGEGVADKEANTLAVVDDEPLRVQKAVVIEPSGDVDTSSNITQAKSVPADKNQGDKEAHKHEDRGRIFYAWLRAGIADKSIKYNGTGAPVHVVDWGLKDQAVLLCSPRIFKDCFDECQAQLNTDKWEHVQKGFSGLGMCEPALHGMVHSFTIAPKKDSKKKGSILKGFIILDVGMVFSGPVHSNPVLIPPKPDKA